MWDLTIHPTWGPTSLLAHRTRTDSDTICNNPSPPLVNTVCFGLLCIVVSLMVIKHVYKREVSTPLYKMFRSSIQLMRDLTYTISLFILFLSGFSVDIQILLVALLHPQLKKLVLCLHNIRVTPSFYTNSDSD